MLSYSKNGTRPRSIGWVVLNVANLDLFHVERLCQARDGQFAAATV
jgi:hypothetical protein